MPIKGFVEYADGARVRGWAYDPAFPSRRLEVVVEVADQVYASGRADIYRNDLASAGIDDGGHGFSIDVGAANMPADASSLLRVCAVSGAERLTLRRVHPKGIKALELTADDQIPVSDASQFPVFILGAARSGTSAVALALLHSERYHGAGEGHFLPLADKLLAEVAVYYHRNAAAASQGTTLHRVPSDALSDYIRRGFIQLARRLYPTAYWIDKTPSVPAVLATPLMLQLWPNARFVFMRRRVIENLLSRRRKFPQGRDESQYSDWAAIMRAWLRVRAQLGEAAIEIDHRQLVCDPAGTSASINAFLGIPEPAATRVRDYLVHNHPEQTDANFGAVHSLASLEMTEPELKKLRAACDEVMNEFGYTYDASYSRQSS
jgi:Sulfotransferase family